MPDGRRTEFDVDGSLSQIPPRTSETRVGDGSSVQGSFSVNGESVGADDFGVEPVFVRGAEVEVASGVFEGEGQWLR